MLDDNVCYYIVDSTLRDSWQNSLFDFTLDQKKQFLLLLDDFGIEYVELTNPNSSSEIYKECRKLLEFKIQNKLSIKMIAYINNVIDIECVLTLKYFDGIHLVVDTNSDFENILENLKHVKRISPDIQICFSIKDSFKTDCNILSNVFLLLEDYIDRIGVIDNIGAATHQDVEDILSIVENITSRNLPIECQFHNNSSSAVYNSFVALTNGCTYINTSVLGERNGITDLSGLISRLYTTYPNLLTKYKLSILKDIDIFVSDIIHINNPGLTFTNESGIHNFIKQHLPKHYSNLTSEYIEKLHVQMISDVSFHNDLYIKLNTDLDFAKSYILSYIN